MQTARVRSRKVAPSLGRSKPWKQASKGRSGALPGLEASHPQRDGLAQRRCQRLPPAGGRFLRLGRPPCPRFRNRQVHDDVTLA